MLKFLFVAISALAYAACAVSLSSDPTILEPNGPYNLHLFEKDGNARCLDGSPSGVYLHTNSASKQYIIFFQGGGWCTSPHDCLSRSRTDLGSSTNWPQSASAGGLMSPDCRANPVFCEWNLIYIPYCDGNSFTGSRATPLEVDGTPLYFRGAETSERVLDWAVEHLGLADATDVVLSGCSAGGLASILNANRMSFFLRQRAPGLKRVRVVPLSGVFLDAPSVEGDRAYGDGIRALVNMSEPRYTHRDDAEQDPCLRENKGKGDPSACHFAEKQLPFVKEPVFVVNSVVDSWCVPCILANSKGRCGAAPGWGACSKAIANCTASQMPTVTAFATKQAAAVPEDRTPSALDTEGAGGDVTTMAMRFAGLLPPSNTAAGAKVGAFLHTCNTHCEGAVNAGWSTFAVEGVTIRDAVAGFVFAPEDEPAKRYLPCEWKSEAPWQCNPTCPA